MFEAAFHAAAALRKACNDGNQNPEAVMKSWNPDFLSQFGGFQHGIMGGGGNNWANQLVGQLNELLTEALGKSITLTSPLATGLVPFDLRAPSQLIYPVRTLLRNKIPRTQGQGTSMRRKVITGISGSRTGGSVGNAQRISISELNGGSLSSWPLSLPPSGSQASVDLNIPYAFFGKTEAVSWLAQFAGQGFEDVDALANLWLMQEMFLGEEDQILSSTATAVAAPGTPTVVARTAGSNETPVTGVTTNIYVRVTASNYYGETAASTVVSVALNGSTQVADVTIVPSKGAFTYNIYVGTGASDPGRTATFLAKAGVGGAKYTIQGAVPASGNVPPAADTGTSSSSDYEGMLSVLDGHASIDASVYPSGFTGGYINKSVGSTLTHTVINAGLYALWDGIGTGTVGAQGFRADPEELMMEGSDAGRFADEVISAGANTNYRLAIDQTQVDGIKVGAAVSTYQNPVTRSNLAVVVHPTLPQGTVFGMTYALPMTFSQTPNAWENVMVQDLISVKWPVIDQTFRQSAYEYGALCALSPMYTACWQGIAVSGTTPYA
jgi:hypothetical protein